MLVRFSLGCGFFFVHAALVLLQGVLGEESDELCRKVTEELGWILSPSTGS